jgi:hypothetical protein
MSPHRPWCPDAGDGRGGLCALVPASPCGHKSSVGRRLARRRLVVIRPGFEKLPCFSVEEAGPLHEKVVLYVSQNSRRRRKPTPVKAVPRSARLAGSGTAVVFKSIVRLTLPAPLALTSYTSCSE